MGTTDYITVFALFLLYTKFVVLFEPCNPCMSFNKQINKCNVFVFVCFSYISLFPYRAGRSYSCWRTRPFDAILPSYTCEWSLVTLHAIAVSCCIAIVRDVRFSYFQTRTCRWTRIEYVTECNW